MSDTGPLFLDERLSDDLWIKGRSGYPALTEDVRKVLNVVAEGLCISQARLQWAYSDGLANDNDGWTRLREHLMSKPVRMITRA